MDQLISVDVEKLIQCIWLTNFMWIRHKTLGDGWRGDGKRENLHTPSYVAGTHPKACGSWSACFWSSSRQYQNWPGDTAWDFVLALVREIWSWGGDRRRRCPHPIWLHHPSQWSIFPATRDDIVVRRPEVDGSHCLHGQQPSAVQRREPDHVVEEPCHIIR